MKHENILKYYIPHFGDVTINADGSILIENLEEKLKTKIRKCDLLHQVGASTNVAMNHRPEKITQPSGVRVGCDLQLMTHDL